MTRIQRTSLKPLIQDCDTGQDDAISLMMNMASSCYLLEGITTVGGNVTVDRCALNSRRIVELCRKNIPVYVGASQPLERQLITLECVFGQSGMAGGDDLPDNSSLQGGMNAVDYLVRKLTAPEQPYTLCATAPLTNLALAIRQAPTLTNNIEQLVLMGGCPYPEPLWGEMGNIEVKGTSGKAEYNFAMDPEAADIVFRSGIRNISMIGLNVTRRVLFNRDWGDRMYALGNRVAQKAADILGAVGEEDITSYAEFRQSANDPVRAVHDAVAAAYLEAPDLFTMEETYIRIETCFVYLAAIMDLYSRKVVGWAISKNIDQELCLEALAMALLRRRPLRGLIHHSDRGVQYASHAYIKMLTDHG